VDVLYYEKIPTNKKAPPTLKSRRFLLYSSYEKAISVRSRFLTNKIHFRRIFLEISSRSSLALDVAISILPFSTICRREEGISRSPLPSRHYSLFSG